MGRSFRGRMLESPNFGFLAKKEPQLALLATQAERYFSEDPATALFKVRQFAELLAKLIAARHSLYEGEQETFECCWSRSRMNGTVAASLRRVAPENRADQG